MTGIVEWVGGKVLDAAWDEATKRIFRARLDKARKILLEELERGTANLTDAEDQDEAAAMVFDYAEAARKGAARRNLRMMAQVLAGKLVTPPIYADEFTKWSRVLSELTHEEIIVMATYYSAEESDINQDGAEAPRALATTTAEMVRKRLCQSENEVRAILQSLGRYGLFLQASAFGTIVYSRTSRLRELMTLVRIDAVLAEPER